MTAPHCGRLDCPAGHYWTRGRHHDHWGYLVPAQEFWCQGAVTTEGGQTCVTCQAPVAGCRCDQEHAHREWAEWWGDAS